MVAPIVFHPIVLDIFLPFILVFFVVFAILEKTEIFGKEKKQIDAFIALAMGLIAIAFRDATVIIQKLMPVLAVGVVAILVLLLMYGMVFKDLFEDNKTIKIILGIVVTLVVVVSLIIFTGVWDYMQGMFDASSIVMNVIVVLVIIAAISVVLISGKSDKKD